MDETYEYAEVTVGFFNRGVGVPALTFLVVIDITGRQVKPDSKFGALDALNMMGAQGWQYLRGRKVRSGHMAWIWSQLMLHDDKVDKDQWEGEEFLLMRRVRE